jgi:cardiolipin synthase
MNLANRLTLLRILLVPAFIASLLYYAPERHALYFTCLGIFFLACITDGLDGFVAKRFNEKTEFGSYMDPLADKLLLVSGFLSLSLMDHLPEGMHIPAWVTIPVISRDVLILAGSLIVFMATGKLKARPLFIGKLTTVAQMTTLSLSLLMAPLLLREVFYFAVLTLTVWSGALYIGTGSRLFEDA